MLFNQIRQNKRNTWIIIGLFIILLLIVSAIISVYLQIISGVIFFVVELFYMMYLYFNATRHLMTITNARRITKESDPKIYEMVEELCLAAGLPMPELYIVPDPSPNAFATGRDPEHASLALTQGLLNIMDDHEIQGVIGHELSHIRNYDSRITVLCSAIVSLIIVTGVGLVVTGWSLITMRSHGIIILIFRILGIALAFVGIIVSIVGIPLAKLLFLLMSRQREYLADVGSVDLTREPSGLISALDKLEKIEETESSAPSKNLMLNSLYFNLPSTKTWFLRLFSDHPPLDKRIQRLKNSDKF